MAAKAPSFESAVLARIPGSTEHGPWLTCDGRLARVVEKRLELVDPKSGAVTGSFEHQSPWIAIAAGAPAVMRDVDDDLVVCDLEGAVRAQLAGERDFLSGPRPLAISPDGRLVAGTEKGRMLWDARTGACIASDESGYAGEASFSPDGRLIAFTHGPKPCVLIEVDGWTAHPIAGSGSKGRGVAPAFSPSGARVCFALGRKLLVADVATHRSVAELKSTKDVFAMAWLDEDTIAIAARSSLVIRRVSDGAELATLPIRCTALATDASATKLACAVAGVWVKGTPVDELAIVLLDVPALLELVRAAPPTERPKKKPAKKRARPVNGCFFGVPASIPIERIESAAKNLHYILDRRPEDFVLLVQPDEAVATLRWFTFVGSRGRHYLLAPWTESLVVDLGELTVALRSVAGTRFERFESGSISPSCALVSDGKAVRARAGEPAEGTDAIAAGLARFHPSEPADGYASALSGRAIRIRGDQDATKLVNMLDLIDAHRR